MATVFPVTIAPRKRSLNYLLRLLSWLSCLACVAAGCVSHAPPAAARIWEVGPGRPIASPAQAAAAVRDGDRVIFDPGVYQECAIWTASHLTIEARRPPATMNQTVMTATVITGQTCADRGLFVFYGHDIAVRGMTFMHARDSQHTGAGILMEGANLTVENSLFIDNENGILTGGPPDSVVRIAHDLFRGNGACVGSCGHGLYAGAPIARLEVSDSTFLDTRFGHHIKSRARSTIVRNCQIADGPNGNSSYLIEMPNGGDVQILNNTMQKGIHTENIEAAISIGAGDLTNRTRALWIRGNRFTSDLPGPVRFVRNRTETPARLTGNTLVGNVIPLDGPGTVD